jgi:acyl-CoA synthetase (AMP-forming)/AMP-acid ligase II
MVFNAVIGARGCACGSNPSYTQQEFVHFLRASETKFMLVEPGLLKNALAAAKACNIAEDRIWVFNPRNLPCSSHLRPWTWLLDQGEEDWHHFDDLEMARSTTAARLFTSGTSGLPKAANISHHNLVAHHVLGLEHEEYQKDWPVIRILPLPFFHAAMVSAAHHAVLRLGFTAYVMRRFDVATYLKNVERFGVTELSLVPPLVVAIIMSPLVKEYSLKHVRFGQVGAAPLDKDTQGRLLQLLHPKARFTQVSSLR